MLKTLFTSFILFFILSAAFSSNIIYSQQQTEIDSLVTGKKYRITLYDDKEVIGKVARQDSVYAYIITETATVRLKKDDIFSISKNTVPTLIKAMFSLGGGFLLITGGDNYYTRNTKPGYSIYLTGLIPLNENRAVRLDLGYGRLKKDEYVYASYNGYNSSEGAQTRDVYSMHVNFLFGDFMTGTKFSIYGLGGAGVVHTKESDFTSSYYDSYDSVYHYNTTPGESITSVSFAIGGGFKFSITKRLGFFAEAQYNMSSYEGVFLFFGRGYFPIRGGFSYSIF